MKQLLLLLSLISCVSHSGGGTSNQPPHGNEESISDQGLNQKNKNLDLSMLSGISPIEIVKELAKMKFKNALTKSDIEELDKYLELNCMNGSCIITEKK